MSFAPMLRADKPFHHHPTAASSNKTKPEMRKARILFVSLTDDTGSERLPMELLGLGVDCACLSPPVFQTTNVTGLTHFRLPAHRGLWLGAIAVRSGLRHAAKAFAPDLLVPLDDLAAWILRGLCDSRHTPASLRGLIERSTGAPRGRDAARWRVTLMAAAQAADVPVPAYQVFGDRRALMIAAPTLAYPTVVKEENSCGGRGVVIAQSEAELRKAFEAQVRPFSIPAAIKRLRGWARRTTWHAAGMPTGLWRSMLVQQRVEGRPALCTVVAEAGRVLESLCFVTERNHPTPTGAATVVRFIAHARMETYAARLVERLGFSGFVSFDFILSPDESDATLIEMNARPVGTVHLGRRFGRDLCEASLRLLDAPPPEQRRPMVTESRRIALFPKELERAPTRFIDGVPVDLIHDVPWSEGAVVDSYGRRLVRLHPRWTKEIWRQLGKASDNTAITIYADPEATPRSSTGHEASNALLTFSDVAPADGSSRK